MGLGKYLMIATVIGVPTYYYLNKSSIDAKLAGKTAQVKRDTDRAISNTADKARSVASDAANKIADNKDAAKNTAHAAINKAEDKARDVTGTQKK